MRTGIAAAGRLNNRRGPTKYLPLFMELFTLPAFVLGYYG
jgi:hypothetical protein